MQPTGILVKYFKIENAPPIFALHYPSEKFFD
jgi:hypothetical protein